ncbi:MAG TPA: hypothetical protein VMV05_02220 [bacterium]|nr:hypothetical protein [bacterium]
MKREGNEILILERDTYFRNLLEGICVDFGKTITVSNLDMALSHLTETPFRLILLDWNQIHPHFLSIYPALQTFQTEARVLALFMAPDLTSVITAMKSGISDVLWAAQKRETLLEKIRETLSGDQPTTFNHSFVSRLAQSLTEKSVVQKTTLFAARKEFSKTFLTQILAHNGLKRTELANLLRISPRTLQRHLSH